MRTTLIRPAKLTLMVAFLSFALFGCDGAAPPDGAAPQDTQQPTQQPSG